MSFEFWAIRNNIRLKMLFDTHGEKQNKTTNTCFQASVGKAGIQLKASNYFPRFIVDKRSLLDLLLTDKRLTLHIKKRKQKCVFYLINGTHFPKSHHNASVPPRFTSRLTSEEITSSFPNVKTLIKTDLYTNFKEGLKSFCL